MEFPQAEQYKIAYGLREEELEGKVKKALSPIFDLVVGEIRKAAAFWNEKEKDPIKNIILSGGSANLPEAATVLAKALGVEVQIADPFKNLVVDEKIMSGIREKFPLFVIAVGLSERGV
jgi:type IV pilus assembly protein PilM